MVLASHRYFVRQPASPGTTVRMFENDYNAAAQLILVIKANAVTNFIELSILYPTKISFANFERTNSFQAYRRGIVSIAGIAVTSVLLHQSQPEVVPFSHGTVGNEFLQVLDVLFGQAERVDLRHLPSACRIAGHQVAQQIERAVHLRHAPAFAQVGSGAALGVDFRLRLSALCAAGRCVGPVLVDRLVRVHRPATGGSVRRRETWQCLGGR